MKDAIKLGKIVGLFFLAAVILSLTSFGVILAYHNLFKPDLSYYPGAYPCEKLNLGPEAVILNLSQSDFDQYPFLNQLINNPEGDSIHFNDFEWNSKRIQDFRNHYCYQNENEKYVFWNGTYYQIVVAQT